MADTTTIAVDRSTKSDLDDLVEGRSFNEKLQKLIDAHESDTNSLDENDVRVIAERVVEDMVTEEVRR